MNDAHDPDHEPTVPLASEQPELVRPQWAPPAADAAPLEGVAPPAPPETPETPVAAAAPVPPAAPAPGPEPTRPLPELFGSVLPPAAPSVPAPGGPAPTGPDLAVRLPGPRQPGTGVRLPVWVLPVVALVALIVGLGGGLLGAVAYDRIADDSPAGPGYSDGGLAGVDLEDQAPLAAPGSVADVAQAVLPSTVQIIAEYRGEATGASGSGWVMDGDGHIVTNNHVVADAAKNNGPIIVVDNDRNRYDAEVVGRSTIYDLAVLYVKDHDKLKPAKLGYSSKLQVGEPVVAIGSPLSLPSTVTSGIVSYLHRPVTTGGSSGADSQSWIDAIQTDAAINPGNSGGPLVNQKGEVVGVNSAIATAGGGSIDSEAGNIGVGFAIPVEQVRVTADQILKTGKAQYPLIGANVKTGGIPTGDGAQLEKITSGSPAEKAGLRRGDVITHVNGSRVADGTALIVAIRTHQPGETIELTFRRGSDEKKADVTLNGQEG